MLWVVVAALLLSLADALFLLVVAGYIGALETVGLVVLTAFLGVLLVRSEGQSTLRRMQIRLQQMEPPTDELMDGAMILLGAGLLITPGLLTDLTGFLLVMPVTRYPLRVALKRWVVGPWIRKKVASGDITIEVDGSTGPWSSGNSDHSPDPDVWEDGDQAGSDFFDLDDSSYDIFDDDEDR